MVSTGQHAPESSADGREKLILLRTKQLRTTKGDDRQSVAAELVELNRTVGEQLLGDGSFTKAMASYRRALVLAKQYVPQAEASIQAEYKYALGMLKTLRQVELLESKLLKDANDSAAAEELAVLYLLELSRPDKAVRLVDRVKDRTLKGVIAGAQKSPADCDEATVMMMGTWYHDATSSTTGQARTKSLQKAQVYFQRFLDVHESKDVHRATAELKLASIVKALEAAPSVPARPSATKQVIRYAQGLLVLEVDNNVDVSKLPRALSKTAVKKFSRSFVPRKPAVSQ